MSESPFVCRLCRWATALDDAAFRFQDGYVICLSCWTRVTQTEKPTPARLLREAELTATGGA